MGQERLVRQPQFDRTEGVSSNDAASYEVRRLRAS